MDKKLQKLILGIIKADKGEANLQHITNKATRNYWPNEQPSEATNVIIKHQLDLLEKEDKLIKRDQSSNIFYILTPFGYREFDSCLKKIWWFILYDKHNLFILLSLLISIIALAVSILYKK
ncbi:MAG: hypothetical protein QMD50_01490 [Patescibacteria group bacterium]|nr:hypothetical protein [Patescibacteria group bacterium]